MLRPSKKLALALEAVTDIAFHGGAEPVQSQDIAERLGLPRRYLEQVMQQLVRAGVLRGVRGPRGGYRLARERRRITVGQVVRVVQGEDGDEPPAGSSSPLGVHVMSPFWQQVEEEQMRRLDEVTIDDLCQQATLHGVESGGSRGADFAI
jgi:Rrf2 family iron-sulfur cluster assembly transcriptional regulator